MLNDFPNLLQQDVCPVSPPIAPMPPFMPNKPMTAQELAFQTTQRINAILDDLLKFEQRMKNDFQAFLKNSIDNQNAFSQSISGAFDTFTQTVKNEVNNFETAMNNDYALYKNNLKGDYDNFVDTVNTTVSSFETTINQTVSTFQTTVNQAIDAVEAQQTEYETESTQKYNTFTANMNEAFDNYRDAIEARIDQYNSNYVQAFNDYKTATDLYLETMRNTFNTNYSTFTQGINNSITAFENTWTASIDERLDEQDADISDAILYLKTNLSTTLRNVMNDAITEGVIDTITTDAYNEFSAIKENKKLYTKPIYETPYLSNDENTLFTNSRVDTELAGCELAGINGLVMVIHVNNDSVKNHNTITDCSFYDSATGFYINESVSVLQYMIAQGKLKNMPVKVVKFHVPSGSYFTANGFTAFFNYMNTLLDNVFAMIDDDVEIITLLNECNNIYNVDSNTTAIISLLNKIKTAGYKASITTAGYEDFMFYVKDAVKNALDVICINMYLTVGVNGEDMTQHDFDIASKNTALIYKGIAKKYGKPVYVSEYGTTGSAYSMCQTGEYWHTEFKSSLLKSRYVQSFINSFYDMAENVGVWLWYDMTINDQLVQKTLKERAVNL